MKGDVPVLGRDRPLCLLGLCLALLLFAVAPAPAFASQRSDGFVEDDLGFATNQSLHFLFHVFGEGDRHVSELDPVPTIKCVLIPSTSRDKLRAQLSLRSFSGGFDELLGRTPQLERVSGESDSTDSQHGTRQRNRPRRNNQVPLAISFGVFIIGILTCLSLVFRSGMDFCNERILRGSALLGGGVLIGVASFILLASYLQ